MIQNLTTVQAHGRSELTGLSFLQSNKLVSVGNDSCIKIWDLRNLQQQLCVKLPHSYLTALCPFGKEILVGNGSGELMALDRGTLAVNSVRKVHTDCINDIKIFENKIVTASSDGSMAVIDPLSQQEIRSVSVGSPLRQVQRYKSGYYLGGSRSFEVDQQYKVKRSSNISRFLSAFGQLYGTNDEKGFLGISKKYNTYVPCENMIEFSQGILGVSWSTLTFFTTYPDDDRISYSSTRLGGVVEGDSILSMTAAGKRVFAGSECGNIYTFNVNPNYHWYDDL